MVVTDTVIRKDLALCFHTGVFTSHQSIFNQTVYYSVTHLTLLCVPWSRPALPRHQYQQVLPQKQHSHTSLFSDINTLGKSNTY